MSRPPLSDASTAGGRPVRRGGAERSAVALTIASHPRLERAGERVVLEALTDGREVVLSRNAPDFTAPGARLGAALADPFISRRPLRIQPLGAGGVRLVIDPEGTEVVAGGAGAIVGTLDLDGAALSKGVALQLAGRVVLLVHTIPYDAGRARAGDDLGMVGRGQAVSALREEVRRVAPLEVPVLIRGETGTGKELVARAIHDRSGRRAGPFVSVNLGAIPAELAAAELFGAVKGAYTGAARDREGYFRAARGGTLFLDEVAEAPPELQAMLLRVLETARMYPVGSDHPVATDVRLLAATDADLEEQIRHKRFRGPLLHRLAGYEIRTAPLRERREDIGLLFAHFAQKELAALGVSGRLEPANPYDDPWLPAPIAAALLECEWPGNIRQLRNVTRQLVIANQGRPQIELDARLLQELAPAGASVRPPGDVAEGSTPMPPGPAPRRKSTTVTAEELREALRAVDWDLKPAADRLGIPRSSIYDLLERYPEIRTAGSLSADEISGCFDQCRGDLDAMVAQLQVSRKALARRLKEMGLTTRRA